MYSVYKKENYHLYYCFQSQTKPTLKEEVPNGTEVKTKIYAKDPDTEAELEFSIDWNSSTAYKSNSPANESLYRE